MADLPATRNIAYQGMIPITDLTTSYISSLASATIGEWIETYDIEEGEDFTSDEFVGEWQEWMWWGLLFCVLLGLVFMLITPICGCCYCCWRTCCGCCQPQTKVKRFTDQPSQAKSVGCSVTLFVLSSCMFSASILSLVSLSMMKYELSAQGITNDWQVSLRSIETYLNDSVKDIDRSSCLSASRGNHR